MNKRKKTFWAKLKAASQEERIQMWKEHFRDLLGKSPKHSTKIIDNQLKHKHKTMRVYSRKALTKVKNRKTSGLDEIPLKVWKTMKFDDLLLQYCNAVYNQNTIDRWTKGYISTFPKKSDLGITKNYWDITLTSIVAMIYNTLLLNRIKPEIEKILRKNQNGETSPQHQRFWQSIES